MTFQSDLFVGKYAFVTGDMSGIGAAIAEQLAALGACVVAAGLPATSTMHDTYKSEVKKVALDVRSNDNITRVLGSFDRLDIVVNCAAVISRVEERKLEVFERVVDINLTGTMRVCTAAHDLLKASSGCIVNTASMLSYIGGGLLPAYSASKGAISQLTKSLAIAYAADETRVNAIAPGWIATPLTQTLQNDDARSKRIIARTPMARWGPARRLQRSQCFCARRQHPS